MPATCTLCLLLAAQGHDTPGGRRHAPRRRGQPHRPRPLLTPARWLSAQRAWPPGAAKHASLGEPRGRGSQHPHPPAPRSHRSWEGRRERSSWLFWSEPLGHREGLSWESWRGERRAHFPSRPLTAAPPGAAPSAWGRSPRARSRPEPAHSRAGALGRQPPSRRGVFLSFSQGTPLQDRTPFPSFSFPPDPEFGSVTGPGRRPRAGHARLGLGWRRAFERHPLPWAHCPLRAPGRGE